MANPKCAQCGVIPTAPVAKHKKIFYSNNCIADFRKTYCENPDTETHATPYKLTSAMSYKVDSRGRFTCSQTCDDAINS